MRPPHFLCGGRTRCPGNKTMFGGQKETCCFFLCALNKTNIFAPENRPSQKETSIPTIHFQVLCYRMCIFVPKKSSCNVAFLQATPILVSKVLMGQEKTGRKDRGSSGIYDKIMKTTHITTRWAQKPIINGVITALMG